MAFWKLKLFKNGSSQKHAPFNENVGGHHLREEINEEKTDYIFKTREDSPKRDSVSSLEEAYANLPLVKAKPDVIKRQLTKSSDGRSLTMEEARRQQQLKETETTIPYSDGSPENNITVGWQQPPKSPDDQLTPVGLPSWRNEKLNAIAKAPASVLLSNFNNNNNNNGLSDHNGKQYSPSLSSSERSRTSHEAVAKSSSPDNNRGKNLHISSISIPHQPAPSTPCFVVNSPCMFTGSYPCYVMNVVQSTPYVPVQFYPMMLVPNQQQLPNRMTNKMVY